MPARAQLTLRVDERLARHLKQVAAERGLSVNAFAEQALAAAVDPDAAGSEIERHRERLARAGLLGVPQPVDFEPPSEEELEEARRAAGRGTSLSDLIVQERDEERG
jgi:predicted transcriptional regulator